MFSVRHLEPSELCACLPRPLSAVIVDIVSDVLKDSSVITIKRGHAHLIGNLLNHCELGHDCRCLDTSEDITEALSVAVLNLAGKDISEIVHKVAVIEALGNLEGVDHILSGICWKFAS